MVVQLLYIRQIVLLNILIIQDYILRFSPENRTFPWFSDRVVFLILWQHFCEAKVTNLYSHLTLNQDVSGRQVSVDITLHGEVIHALQKPTCQLRDADEKTNRTLVDTLQT